MVEGFGGSGFRVPPRVAVRVPSRVALKVALRGSYAKSMRIRLVGCDSFRAAPPSPPTPRHDGDCDDFCYYIIISVDCPCSSN